MGGRQVSIHTEAATKAIITQAAYDSDLPASRFSSDSYRSIVEALAAAETAEARVTIAELRLANEILRGENQRLTTAAAQVTKATP